MSILLVLVPAAPLLAALAISLFGRRLPRSGGWLTVAGTGVSLLALVPLLGRNATASAIWGHTAGLTLTVGLQTDRLGQFMALLVAGVALLVEVYAVAYMADEEDQPRFFTELSFFVGSMLALVLANSFVILFAAWEAVGVASFLLIGFWHREPEARAGAQKAFLLTRLGDVGFLLGWLLAMQQVGTTHIGTFLDAISAGSIAAGMLTWLAFLFLAGAVGKSAQLPLSAWLPAAMVGPTPVSALIHSATMVAAGVYLLLRLFPLFAAAPLALSAVLWLGGLTALFAALVATVQYDIKRILAWSTVSQLGEMMLALGLAGPLAAAYHLATHATFKSALFLVAGAIDHAAGSRDLRRLGRLASKMVVTAAVFGVAALALAGVPPLSGFWSEDQILGQAVERGPGFVILMLTLIALAGVYISRLGVAAFGAWPDAPEPDAHAAGRLMQVPMIGLAVAAAGLGWLLSGQLGQLLPFGAGHHLSLAWRLAAVAAGLLGLAYGTWWVRTRGSAPAFGAAPGELERVLDVATQAPAQLAFALARALNRVEATLDGAVRHIAHGALRLAAVENAAEAGFDAAAQGLGRAGLAAAGVSNRTETRGFSDTLDAFARLFSRGGGRLRQLQTGKLYLYTLGLFVWVLVISLLGVLFWR